MKFACGFPLVVLMLALAVLAMPATARNGAEKVQQVDAGLFVILVNGQRVATESFHIEQGASASTATSELKVESGEKAAQKAELQISSTGDLRRYEWRELSPGKARIVVEPSEHALIEHITPNPPERPAIQPFVLPPSTMVLDDYVFSHREILVWRYLAQACGNNLQQCRPGRAQFGVLVPRQRMPLLVTVEYVGLEKVKLGNKPQDLSRFNMKASEEDEWVLYLDSNLKLVRIDIPGQKTQVLRQ